MREGPPRYGPWRAATEEVAYGLPPSRFARGCSLGLLREAVADAQLGARLRNFSANQCIFQGMDIRDLINLWPVLLAVIALGVALSLLVVA